MGTAWEKQLSVGNAIIDSEHRNLLDMAYGVEFMIKEQGVIAAAQELDLFERWLCEHFENEKEIALAADFNFSKNWLEHQELKKEFQRMKAELMSKGHRLSDSAARRYAHFLDEWLVAHIIKEDMQMKPVLQDHPYDFLPNHVAR